MKNKTLCPLIFGVGVLIVIVLITFLVGSIDHEAMRRALVEKEEEDDEEESSLLLLIFFGFPLFELLSCLLRGGQNCF